MFRKENVAAIAAIDSLRSSVQKITAMDKIFPLEAKNI